MKDLRMIKEYVYRIINFFIGRIYRIYLYYISENYRLGRLHSKNKPKLFFGTSAIINNKYWSNALRENGYESQTVMSGFLSINKKNDFDLYFDDIIKQSTFKLKYFCKEYVIFSFILQNFDIVHIPFDGLLFYDKWIKKNEINLLKKFGCKIIVLPYGGDFYQYSKIHNLSWRHVLQVNYPNGSHIESNILENIKTLNLNADIIISGYQTDGSGRWSAFPYSSLGIDMQSFSFNENKYNQKDGIKEEVTVVHSPNHRYIKGTEYLLDAVNKLKAEGILIRLILIEKKPNEEVLAILENHADILVEQLVTGYALSAIEGMAFGLPVLSNLSNENQTRAFRRYSYLNECPILTTRPENIKENLRTLVLNPDLRKVLGVASRKYVEKYHSNKTIQYLFGKVYEKIWYGKEVDLMNMFHPLNPDSYNNQSPKIEHPLFENKIPEALLNTLNK